VSERERVRVAVLGLGAVARAVHLPILSRRSDCFEIVGICDVADTALTAVGDRFCIDPQRRFSALEHMLDAVDADALAVLTSGSHAWAAVAGLDRGLAVLSEKPLAVTVREADVLAAAVGAGRDRLMLGYMKLYDPAVRRAADLVAARPRARAVEVTVLHPSSEGQLAASELGPGVFAAPDATVRAFHDQLRALEVEALGPVAASSLGALYSGVLLGSVVHDLAVLRALGIEIAVVDHAQRWPADTVPASLAFHGRTADGVRVSVQWHYLHDYPIYRELVRWHDERGSVELEFPSPYLLRAPTVLRAITTDGGLTGDHRFTSHAEAFEEQLLAFHAMVTNAVAPAAGAPEGRADILTCQRVAAVLARHEAVDIGGEAAHAAPGP
jgi:myo-inositol 2-dehydrogenase / D-chiro-inositol 1-dehydrogenase